MSKTGKPAQRKRWDAYVKEASRDPFVVELDDGADVEIYAPTGGAVIRAQQLAAEGDLEEQIRVICGDAADVMMPLLSAAPAEAMKAFLEDVMAYFGYDTPGEA